MEGSFHSISGASSSGSATTRSAGFSLTFSGSSSGSVSDALTASGFVSTSQLRSAAGATGG